MGAPGSKDRTIRLLNGPPLARDAWREWTALVKAGASLDEREAARARFTETLRRYGK